jgi:hypothetical protein
LLGRFAVALDQAKVTWVALKGPVLAEFSYPRDPAKSFMRSEAA